MLTEFEVTNFRCFRELKIDALERVNLIGGKNNVGKTALLEAIHLHCAPGKPGEWLNVHKLRGIQRPLQAIPEIAGWIFADRSSDLPAQTRSLDAQNVERQTQLYFVDAAVLRERFPDAEQSLSDNFAIVAGSDAPCLILRQATEDEPYASIAAYTRTSFISPPTRSPHGLPTVFLGSLASDPERDVRHFGDLAAAKRLGEILPSLQEFEPQLNRLCLIPLGGQAAIHADLDGLDGLIPVALLGKGVQRLLSILLAMANVKNGVLCIDAIENGLHYSVHRRMWSVVAGAARRCNVQVFATTQSFECIEAAHHVFEEGGVYDFRYLRLERRGDNIVSVPLDRYALDVVERSDLEIR